MLPEAEKLKHLTINTAFGFKWDITQVLRSELPLLRSLDIRSLPLSQFPFPNCPELTSLKVSDFGGLQLKDLVVLSLRMPKLAELTFSNTGKFMAPSIFGFVTETPFPSLSVLDIGAIQYDIPAQAELDHILRYCKKCLIYFRLARGTCTLCSQRHLFKSPILTLYDTGWRDEWSAPFAFLSRFPNLENLDLESKVAFGSRSFDGLYLVPLLNALTKMESGRA